MNEDNATALIIFIYFVYISICIGYHFKIYLFPKCFPNITILDNDVNQEINHSMKHIEPETIVEIVDQSHSSIINTFSDDENSVISLTDIL